MLDGPPVPGGPALVCFPSAGAGVGMFRRWHRDLGGRWEVHRVRLAGREARMHEPHPRSIEAAVEELLPGLEELADRPLVLFGHSMGGLLAYEACRRLELDGRSVAGLVVAATSAPVDRPGRAEAVDRSEQELLHDFGGNVAVAAMQELMRPTLRRDVAMCRAYVDRSHRVAAPLLVLWSPSDRIVPEDHVLDWRRLAAARVDIRAVDGGGHHFVLERRAEVLSLVREHWLDPRPREGSS